MSETYLTKMGLAPEIDRGAVDVFGKKWSSALIEKQAN